MLLIPETLQANPSAIMSHGTIVGPALGECIKDANTPVRLAAERCALHAFQLTKGTSPLSCLCSLCCVRRMMQQNIFSALPLDVIPGQC